MTSRIPEESPPTQQADSSEDADNCRGERVYAGRARLEPGTPASEAGVVPVPPPRIDQFVVWTEDSNSQPPASDAGALHCATSSRFGESVREPGIPARSERLVQVVLTAGVEPACRRCERRASASWATSAGTVASVDRAGFEPATFSVQGSTLPDAPRPWWRGRESNPPRPGV